MEMDVFAKDETHGPSSYGQFVIVHPKIVHNKCFFEMSSLRRHISATEPCPPQIEQFVRSNSTGHGLKFFTVFGLRVVGYPLVGSDKINEGHHKSFVYGNSSRSIQKVYVSYGLKLSWLDLIYRGMVREVDCLVFVVTEEAAFELTRDRHSIPPFGSRSPRKKEEVGHTLRPMNGSEDDQPRRGNFWQEHEVPLAR